tara:strand:+ start:106 stop:567 length:462 start_codon:yes stop_codon:yes gene_type:complete
MKAKIFEVMLKKIDQKKKLLEIEINKILGRRRALDSKIQSIDSYIKEYNHDLDQNLKEQSLLEKRNNIIAFIAQLDEAKKRLGHAIFELDTKIKLLRARILDVHLESIKYKKLAEAQAHDLNMRDIKYHQKQDEDAYLTKFVTQKKRDGKLAC